MKVIYGEESVEATLLIVRPDLFCSKYEERFDVLFYKKKGDSLVNIYMVEHQCKQFY